MVGGQGHGTFSPLKDPISLVQEAGWGPGPIWMGAKKFTATGIFGACGGAVG